MAPSLIESIGAHGLLKRTPPMRNCATERIVEEYRSLFGGERLRENLMRNGVPPADLDKEVERIRGQNGDLDAKCRDFALELESMSEQERIDEFLSLFDSFRRAPALIEAILGLSLQLYRGVPADDPRRQRGVL